jgi:hypothetical protein
MENKKINIEILKIVLMIGLIVIMIVLAIVIYKYTQQIKLNPCQFCECNQLINLTQLKGGY